MRPPWSSLAATTAAAAIVGATAFAVRSLAHTRALINCVRATERVSSACAQPQPTRSGAAAMRALVMRAGERALFASSSRCLSSMRTRAPKLPIKSLEHAKYGGRYTVTAIAGDGIGAESLAHVATIFRHAKVPCDFEITELSSNDLTDEALENAIISIKRNGLAIKGNVETKFDTPNFASRNVALRRRLDLFANVLHCVSIPSIPTRHKNLDIVIIRENTEGEYSGLEHESVPGVIESLKIVTRAKIERIAKFAFDYAVLNNRRRITAVHKANIVKLGDGLFLKVCRDMAARPEYSNIEFDAMIVDNASMQLVARPEQFAGSILLMPNLYGNIISNIACGLAGGPGLIAGINIGEQYAIFETATRNTGTALVGRDIANPVAFVRASVDMLRYLHLDEHADRISDAVYKTLTVDKRHTPDIGGDARSSEVIDAIISHL